MPLDGAILGEGIYQPSEAARLIGVKAQDVLRWTRGTAQIQPIWKAHYQFIDDTTEISFADLVELRVVRSLRSKGISLQAIRFAVDLAQSAFGIDRPLSSVAFKNDGREILMDAIEKDGQLVSLSKNRPTQKVFKQIISQSVSGLEYDGKTLQRWRPTIARHVVIDPQRAFGTPVIDKVGISTKVIFREWERFKNYKTVSQIYEVDETLVKDAVQYEDKLNHFSGLNSGQGSF